MSAGIDYRGMADNIGRVILGLILTAVFFIGLTVFFVWLWATGNSEKEIREKFEREAVKAGAGINEQIWRPETGWRTEFRFRNPEIEYKNGKIQGFQEALQELSISGTLQIVPGRIPAPEPTEAPAE